MSRKIGDHEWFRMINAFILCDLFENFRNFIQQKEKDVLTMIQGMEVNVVRCLWMEWIGITINGLIMALFIQQIILCEMEDSDLP